MVRIHTLMRTGKTLAVVIPRDIQRALGMVLGDRVAVSVQGDCVIVRRLDENQLAAFLAAGVESPARSRRGA